MKKSKYTLNITETEEKDIHKNLDNKEIYNTDLAIIGAIILEAMDRGDLKKIK